MIFREVSVELGSGYKQTGTRQLGWLLTMIRAVQHRKHRYDAASILIIGYPEHFGGLFVPAIPYSTPEFGNNRRTEVLIVFDFLRDKSHRCFSIKL
jgi:hypothetical protein